MEDIFPILVMNSYDIDLREIIFSNAWYEKFIFNVHEWAVSRDKPLTTEQARITLRIIQKVRTVLIDRGWASETDLTRILSSPTYRHTPTQSANIPREVRYLGDNLFGFRMKRNDVITNQFKLLGGEWDWMSRLWLIPVTRATINPVMELIRDHQFGFDDAVAEYLALVTNSDKEESTFYIDPTSGKIICTINNNEVVAEWVATALKGEAL